uniref:Uncharacterized protein n=1 Tax=Panagrolaimus sp. ES5 TaxID=591445 RepID=A0AC34F3J9_9BILA
MAKKMLKLVNSNYANVFPDQPLLPLRLPLSGNYFIDTRKRGERNILNPEWKPKNGKRPLRIEFIDSNDIALVGNFYNHHFNKHGNICQSRNMKDEETEKFKFDTLKNVLTKPLSFAAFEGDKIVALKLNRIHFSYEFERIFGGKIFETNPKFDIKSDYAVDILNGPYSLNANRVKVILDEALRQTGKFLPKNITNLGVLKSTGIHPEYMG